MEDSPEQFRAYLDESENSSGEIYVVGGFVGRTAVWDSLKAKWLACLPAGLTAFHATDCFTGNNEFEGVNIGARRALLDRLTAVITAHDIRLVGYGINAKRYRELAPKAKDNEFLRNKYAAPFGGAIELACHAMGNLPTPQTIWKILDNGEQCEQCAFFIESNQYSPSANKTIADLRQSKDLWFRHRIGTDKYGAKSGAAAIPLLQVADFGVFLAAKYISKAPEGKISWKEFYEKLRVAGHVYRTVIADERSLNLLHQTHKELKQEAAERRTYWDDI